MDEEQKRAAIAAAVALTLTPGAATCYYEEIILEQYRKGHLTLAEAMGALDEYNELAMRYYFLPPSLRFLSQERVVDTHT